jgi:predicted amidophosphoribosyltransferase
MANPNRCPSCGEHVSPFAAGCARCGASLDPSRGRYQSPVQKLRSLFLAVPRLVPRIPLPIRRK